MFLVIVIEPTSRRLVNVMLLPCWAMVIWRPFVLPLIDPSSDQPAGMVSVTVHDVPTGIPLTVAVPLAELDALIEGVNVPAAPQFTTYGKVPETGMA